MLFLDLGHLDFKIEMHRSVWPYPRPKISVLPKRVGVTYLSTHYKWYEISICEY